MVLALFCDSALFWHNKRDSLPYPNPNPDSNSKSNCDTSICRTYS